MQMLRWQKQLYTGEKVKEPHKIRRKIEAGKFVPGIYLLTLSENPANVMEIIPAAMLLQRSYVGICPAIIGMAKGKDEAMELVRSIIEEVYGATGSFSVSEYLENR